MPGAEDLAYCDLEPLVAEGGRFVAYTYCFSVLIMTFKRHSGIHFIRPGQSGARAAWGWSALTMLAGWWGFPWGPVYSISTLYQNCRGGMDVTEAVMATFSGQQRAAQLMARRPKVPVGAGIWALRVAVLAVPLLLIWMIVTAPSRPEREENRTFTAVTPLENATTQLLRRVSGGNTHEAEDLAMALQKDWQASLEEACAKTPGVKKPAACHVWCQLGSGTCAFLVQMGELRNFDDGSKQRMAEAAWKSAQEVLEQAPLGHPELRLAVALHGKAHFDRLLLGDYQAGHEPVAAGRELPASEASRALASYFAPPVRRPAAAAAPPKP